MTSRQMTGEAAPQKTVLDAALPHMDYWWRGVKDALDWPTTAMVIYRDAHIWKRTSDCVKLNGLIFLASLAIFQYALDPLMRRLLDFGGEGEGDMPISSTLSTAASVLNFGYVLTYYVLYVYPVYVLSFVLNAMWYQEIADRAYAAQVGKTYTSPSKLANVIADEVYRSIVILVYMIQSSLLYLVPLVGPVVGFVSLTWLYSFYCFEYKWVNMGFNLQKRLVIFESHWAYFCGFGVPFTFVCVLFPGMMSGGVFALLFPMFVIMANAGQPQPEKVGLAPTHLWWMPKRVPMFYFAQRFVDPIIRWLERHASHKIRQGAVSEQASSTTASSASANSSTS